MPDTPQAVCPHGCNTSTCPCLACEAETATPEPPMPDTDGEPAGGRSCDGGDCDLPSIGWRWYRDLREWLPVCGIHMAGPPGPTRHYDPGGEPVADTWPDVAARIAARWAHGHDELTDECALCHAEYAEARQAAPGAHHA